MARPRAVHTPIAPEKDIRYLIVDGYVDEPAALGVPPYISPHVRAIAGGLVTGGAPPSSVGYLTVDSWRALRGCGWGMGELKRLDAVFCIMGCTVPGKYLRGTPISIREVGELASSLREVPLILWGKTTPPEQMGILSCRGDPGVLGLRFSREGRIADGHPTDEELNQHLREGAFVIEQHPDHPSPLIAEIETSRGCVRYMTGGCSFCMEPARGRIRYRGVDDILEEVRALSEHGVENIRLGGQSDIISYRTPEAGISETPVPDPEVVEVLFNGLERELLSGAGVEKARGLGRRPGLECGIIHTDNANPAIISTHPEEAERILTTIASHTTSGNVLALGLESADPAVTEAENLNSTPEQTIAAIELMNRVGKRRGSNGLPRLLPGINFLGGLPSQTVSSFDHDRAFLQEVIKRGLLLRRINIRTALFRRGGGLRTVWKDGRVKRAYRRFRDHVREVVDREMLSGLLPDGSCLKGVFMEARSGNTTFGRQIGSYPILVGIPYGTDLDEFRDVIITDRGRRSVTGFITPFHVNRASLGELTALPGVGRKRAASIKRASPLDRELLRRIAPETDPYSGSLRFDP